MSRSSLSFLALALARAPRLALARTLRSTLTLAQSGAPRTIFVAALLAGAPLSGCSSIWTSATEEEMDQAADADDVPAAEPEPAAEPTAPASIVEQPKTDETELMRSAEEAFSRGLYSVSEKAWIELRDGYPTSLYIPLAEMKIADAQFARRDFAAALASYEEFLRVHPGHEAIPYVRYQIGNCSLEQYQGPERDQAPLQTAVRAFETVIREHPQSEYAVLARRSLGRARELLAEHEAFVAAFYERRELPGAAEERWKALVTKYPETDAARGVLEQHPALEKRLAVQEPPQAPILLERNTAPVLAASPTVFEDDLIRENPSPKTGLAASRSAGGDSLTKEASDGDLLLSAECLDSPGKSIVQIVSRSPLSKPTLSAFGYEFRALAKTSAANVPRSGREIFAHCDESGIDAVVRQKYRPEPVIQVELRGAAAGRIRTLILSRPSRALLVVDLQRGAIPDGK